MQTLNATQFNRIANDKNYSELWNVVQWLPKPHNFFVAGGAIRRTISGESLKEGDIDLFFRTDKDRQKYEIELSERKDFKLIADKEHVSTYEHVHNKDKYEVQLIKIGYYTDASSLLDSFDYTVAQFAMDPNIPEFYAGDFSLYDLGRKRLAVNKITYPVASLRRLIKYTSQGYYACNGCLQEYVNELREIPDADFKNRKISYVD